LGELAFADACSPAKKPNRNPHTTYDFNNTQTIYLTAKILKRQAFDFDSVDYFIFFLEYYLKNGVFLEML